MRGGVPKRLHPRQDGNSPEKRHSPWGWEAPQVSSESTKAFSNHRLHWWTTYKSDLRCSFLGHKTNTEPILGLVYRINTELRNTVVCNTRLPRIPCIATLTLSGVNTQHYRACHFFASLSNCRSLLKSSGPSLKWSFCIALHLRSPVNFYASGNEYGQYAGALLPIHLASTVAKTPLSVKCHQFTISKIAVCLIVIVILEHKFSCWQCDLIQSN